jgi:hypothetical protein
MSRSCYSDDHENWSLIRWRGQVASAIRGKRGQKFLWDLIEALDAMPEKRLIADDLQRDGEVCALGAVGKKRGIELEGLDPVDHATLEEKFNIAYQLVQEIEFMNDDWRGHEAPEQRWERMRRWAANNINPVEVEPSL